jgi:hypothetical protein
MRALLLVLIVSLSAHAAECRALIVVGDPGAEATWRSNFTRWADAWPKALTERCGLKAANIQVLSCPDPGERPTETLAAAIPTHDHVLAALDAFAKSCAPDDQAIVVLIGHGYQSEGVGKLCLPGDDLADAEVARALKPLKTKSAAILLLAPEGAAWAKALAAPGRAVVVANVKQSAPYFGEFLLRALAPDRPLLDAFNQASLATIAWYQNQFEDKKTKVTTVHGKENQDVFRLVYPGKELTPGDAEPRAAVNDINQHAAFDGRRVLAEVAGLEDDGDGTPATIYDQGTDPKPVVPGGVKGADGEVKAADGKLAATLVLGKP